MTDQNLTEIVAIIDRSGSMSGLQIETIGGFNNFVDEQKKAEGKAILTLVQFDDQYQIDYQGLEIDKVPALSMVTYMPRGMTALFDAVGRTINATGARLAELPEEKRPGQVIFLIITDGHENSSREFTPDQVKEMVKHQTDNYNWRFVFLGGGNLEQQTAQALTLGVAANNTYTYGNNSSGTRAVYAAAAAGIARSREVMTSGGVLNASDSLLNDAERKKLEITHDNS